MIIVITRLICGFEQNGPTLIVMTNVMSCHVMSLSVTAYPFPWGHGVLLLEPIPAFLRARAGYSLDNSPAHRRAVMTIVTGIHWLLIRSNQQDEGFKKKKKCPLGCHCGRLQSAPTHTPSVLFCFYTLATQTSRVCHYNRGYSTEVIQRLSPSLWLWWRQDTAGGCWVWIKCVSSGRSLPLPQPNWSGQMAARHCIRFCSEVSAW